MTANTKTLEAIRVCRKAADDTEHDGEAFRALADALEESIQPPAEKRGEAHDFNGPIVNDSLWCKRCGVEWSPRNPEPPAAPCKATAHSPPPSREGEGLPFIPEHLNTHDGLSCRLALIWGPQPGEKMPHIVREATDADLAAVLKAMPEERRARLVAPYVGLREDYIARVNVLRERGEAAEERAAKAEASFGAQRVRKLAEDLEAARARVGELTEELRRLTLAHREQFEELSRLRAHDRNVSALLRSLAPFDLAYGRGKYGEGLSLYDWRAMQAAYGAVISLPTPAAPTPAVVDDGRCAGCRAGGFAICEHMPDVEESPPRDSGGEASVAGSANCPVCGRDEPHAHDAEALSDWLSKMVSRWGFIARVFPVEATHHFEKNCGGCGRVGAFHLSRHNFQWCTACGALRLGDGEWSRPTGDHEKSTDALFYEAALAKKGPHEQREGQAQGAEAKAPEVGPVADAACASLPGREGGDGGDRRVAPPVEGQAGGREDPAVVMFDEWQERNLDEGERPERASDWPGEVAFYRRHLEKAHSEGAAEAGKRVAEFFREHGSPVLNALLRAMNMVPQGSPESKALSAAFAALSTLRSDLEKTK